MLKKVSSRHRPAGPKGVSPVPSRLQSAVPWALLLAFAVVLLSAGPAAAQVAAPLVTLDDCLAQALISGPDALIARSNLAVAQAVRDQSAAKNGFGINGALSGTHGVGYETSSNTNSSLSNALLSTASSNTDTFEGGLNLTAPLATSLTLSGDQLVPETSGVSQATRIGITGSSTLWDGYPGGRNFGAARQADLTLAIGHSTADESKRTLAYQVKLAFFTLLDAQSQVSLLDEAHAARTEDLRRTNALYESGQAAKIDAEQAAIDEEEAAADLAKEKDTLLVDRQNLASLVGWPLEKDFRAAPAESPKPPDLDLDGAIEMALSKRSEIVQLLLQIASGRVAADLAHSQSSPVIGLNGNWAWTNKGGSTSAPSMTSSNPDWSVGLQVSMPIVDAGGIKAQVAQAAAQELAYEQQKTQLVSNITVEVRQAYLALRDLKLRIGLATAGLKLADDQYDLAKTQFREGTGSSQALLAASMAVSSSEAALDQANVNMTLGILSLQNAMGE